MSNVKSGFILLALMTTVFLFRTATPAAAGDNNPMSPGLAAKKEMVRKQQEQRITPEKRKTAADALKAERLKVHRAKQAVTGSQPRNNSNQ